MLGENKENYVFEIVKRALALICIVIGIMLFSFSNPKPYILGFVFGSSINILSFILLKKTLTKAVKMTPSQAYGYTVANYMARYLIYSVVLGISIIADYLNFLTAILGLFTIKVVILSKAFYDSFKKVIKNQRE